MGSNYSGPLMHSSTRTTHHKCRQEHGPWKPDHIESDDEKGYFLAFVVLSVGIGDGKDQSLRKDSGTQDATRYRLIRVSRAM